MISQRRSGILKIIVTVMLVGVICSCNKSEGIVSSEDALASVTAEVMDLELAHAVKVALAEHESLSNADIAVMVNNGEVSLSGNVDNQTQREYALSIARDVAGTEVIDDKLNIREQN